MAPAFLASNYIITTFSSVWPFESFRQQPFFFVKMSRRLSKVEFPLEENLRPKSVVSAFIIFGLLAVTGISTIVNLVKLNDLCEQLKTHKEVMNKKFIQLRYSDIVHMRHDFSKLKNEARKDFEDLKETLQFYRSKNDKMKEELYIVQRKLSYKKLDNFGYFYAFSDPMNFTEGKMACWKINGHLSKNTYFRNKTNRNH